MKAKGFVMISLVLLVVLMLTPGVARAQESLFEEWVATYSWPCDNWNWAQDIAVDNLGNAYVTGNWCDEAATVKYDAAGNELWVARYDGPGNGWDVMLAIGVDSLGNVYVTGGAPGFVGSEYTTIKYNAAGDELWVASGVRGTSVDIAVDSWGNVYVTGNCRQTSGGWSDYATIKYNAAGVEMWVATYNGPGDNAESAKAIAVDNLGNVYVTGSSRGLDTEYDYATIKYNAAGVEMWVARYSSPGKKVDLAEDIAVDNLGNAYVTGLAYLDGRNDIATIKYNAAGDELWVDRYNLEDRKFMGAGGIVLDGGGNVYVTGAHSQGSNYIGHIIKYDSAGGRLWAKTDNRGVGQRITADSSGNVYLAGDDWVVEARTEAEGGISHYSITDWDYPKKTYVALKRVSTAFPYQREAAAAWDTREAQQDPPPHYTYGYHDHTFCPFQDKWYCSELNWAGYYNQGIDLDPFRSPLEVELPGGCSILGALPPQDLDDAPQTVLVGSHTEEDPCPGCTVAQPFVYPFVVIGPYSLILLLSPVDVAVTDPDGLTTSKMSEGIPEAPYIEYYYDENGSYDAIILPNLKMGDYLITVMPEPDASPSDTYTLVVSG
ncbi:SBBP repeat-containing protein, partial [Chloroflexota bacterium]